MKKYINPKLEELLGERIPVLDHGYIMLVDYMGGDECICKAARVSYAEGTKSISNDRGLMRYLLRKRHTSPFEQLRIKLEIKLPIFVERQFVRHRMASHNEMSARYSVLPSEFYSPNTWDIRSQSTTNKQGRGDDLDTDIAESFKVSSISANKDAYGEYEQNLEQGVARELARINLPISIYTKKVWTQDLHNLFHLLKLRLDSHAQLEIRKYAEAIAQHIMPVWVPIAWEAFEDYQLYAENLSRFEIAAIRVLLKKHGVLKEEVLEALHSTDVMHASSISKREANEFLSMLGLADE